MNIQEFDYVHQDGSTTVYVQIENADGSFTSMPKATYEATLAANSGAPQA